MSQDEDENDPDDDDTDIPPLYGSDSVSVGDEPISPGLSAGNGGDIDIGADSFEPSSSAADDDMTAENST